MAADLGDLCGLPSEQEFLAGRLDGHLAGKQAVRNVVRPELARFDLLLDEDDHVVFNLSPAPPAFHPVPPPRPDNPRGSSDYQAGWEQGFEEGSDDLIRHVRAQLAAKHADLFIAADCAITTYEVASQLVSSFRRHVRSYLATPLTDEAIHSFLDQAFPMHAEAPNPASSPEEGDFPRLIEGPEEPSLTTPDHAPREPDPVPTTTTPSFSDRLRGAWAMARKHINRRTAITVLATSLATGAATWLISRATQQPRQPSLLSQNQPQPTGGGYTAPTVWSALPPAAELIFVSIDRGFWVLEQTPQGQQWLNAKFAQIVGAPGNGEWVRRLAQFVADTNRTAYVSILTGGLSQTANDADTRLTIASALYELAVAQNGKGFTPLVITALHGFRNSEPDPEVQVAIQDTLTALGQ